jgi:2-dehydro-3-deoxyphosphogluconate aldolase/(4S)-4-hydroxy-2-oxoglutarate aldolase
VEACAAAVRGGLTVLEVTLTTPGALDAIAHFARVDGVVAGGGTVLTREDARAVAAAGGRFALSPVFDADVVDEAHRLGLLAVPGTATATEILNAHRHGARLVKVFPAAALGGAAYIRALRGPLPHIPLVPTNGITAQNVADYMEAGAVAVGVGGDVFPNNFTLDHVESAARRLRRAMDAARA